MFMKKFVFLMVFILLSSFAYAQYLGIYEPGETLRWSVLCEFTNGTRDSGCSNDPARIFGPLDEVAINGSIFEVGDSLYPGLWRGNYTVGTNNQTGLWTIYVNFTNSDSDNIARVMYFQVVGNNHGIDTIGTNAATAVDNQAVINTNIFQHNTTMKNYCGPGKNLTTLFFYNISDFSIINITYNYSSLGIMVNESYTYDNQSFLSKVVSVVE